ncbi:NACHT domain-containing protein [Paraburkholderia sp. 35.1]|uniref:NACHT domain-containing protein n=1 Tax=Paraburkholderia sp. 35.1 TaxID=2991058 RepID=UPI003D1D6ADF
MVRDANSQEWGRFWVPRSEPIHVDEHGFTIHATKHWREFSNPQLRTTAELVYVSPVTVLLGEPGSGKSFELDWLKKHLETSCDRAVQFLDLGRYAQPGTLEAALRRILKDCIDDNAATVLLLDALDECRVNIKRAEAVLENVLYDVTPSALRIFIACRTPAWPTTFEEMLRAHWKGQEDVGIFEIAPHSREQVCERLREHRIDELDFFKALLHSRAYGLSLQPLGLKFLISQFEDEAEFSTTRWDLYERGCSALLRESKRRLDDGVLALPNTHQRLQLAGLLATCALLTNCTDFVLDGDGEVPQGETACLSAEQLNSIPLLFHDNEWHPGREHCDEILQSGLFVTKSSGVFTFAHRTYAEFLAARFVDSLGLSVEKVTRLLTLPDGTGRLVQQLREFAGWMTHGNRQILEFLLGSDPAFIFDSSVPMADDEGIASAFEELADLVRRYKFPIYELSLIRSYGRLAHPGLREKLRAIVANREEVCALRQFAADVASASGLVNEIAELVDIALNESENYEVRQHAANAVRDAGSSELKCCLLPMMKGSHESDVDDELKGIALHCALDANASVGSLISHLEGEKNPHYAGAYASGMRRMENADIVQSDIVPLIRWLRHQLAPERLDYSWEEFVFHMFSKTASAVIQFDDGWVEFGEAAWLAVSKHHRLSAERQNRRFDSGLELERHRERRLRMFEAMLVAASGNEAFAASTLRSGTGLLTDADGAYLIEAYEREVGTESTQRILANLMLGYLFESDGIVREWVLNAAGPDADPLDQLLAEVVGGSLAAIPLDSPLAETLRNSASMAREFAERKSSSSGEMSVDLLYAALQRAEGGESWQWLNILSYLCHEGEFGGFPSFFDEVTKLPLWTKLDVETHSRLAAVACRYLHDSAPVATELTPNQGNTYEDGGIAALVLLWSRPGDRTSDFLELAVKWSRGLARYNRDGQPRSVVNELLEEGYEFDSGSVLPVLLAVCVRYITHDSPRMPDFADEFMPAALLARLEQTLPSLPDGEGFFTLCTYLLKRNSSAALELLVTRLSTLQDLATHFSSKCLELLAQSAPRKFIDVVWPRLCRDAKAVASFAAEGQLMASSQAYPLLLVEAAVTEQIFEILEESYPSSEDLPTNGPVTRRHHIQEFRKCCIFSLREKADVPSIAALERIFSRHPELPWIASAAHHAEQKAARDAWIPFELNEVAAVVSRSASRVVRTEEELHATVIEELQAIANSISARSAQPLAYFLWDEKSGEPKHEPRLCDWLASELRRRLEYRGAIVNREVQVRAHNPKGVGERTDILIEVSRALFRKGGGDVLRLVIEVKGCWNDELLTAPASQLRDNYMKAVGASTGIYLVMWFYCDRWADVDSRKRRTRKLVPDETVAGCLAAISASCAEASTATALVSPLLIDCTY